MYKQNGLNIALNQDHQNHQQSPFVGVYQCNKRRNQKSFLKIKGITLDLLKHGYQKKKNSQDSKTHFDLQ